MSNKKKCLFVATVVGHIKAFHIPFLKMLKENGYEVHIACKRMEKVEYCDKQFDLSFERFPLKKNNLIAYKELKKIINENNYDMIHCHTPVGGTLARLAAKDARKKGTRVIYTAHGFHFFKGAPLKNWLIYYPIEKILAKYTDTLIAINGEDYERAKNKFNVKQVELIHGVGVDKSRFADVVLTPEEQQNLRKEFKLKKDDYVFVSVGELNKNKNQIMQIEAMREVVKTNKKAKLLIVGRGGSQQFLEDKIKEYNLEKNVVLAGFRKDIPQILKISNCLLATSYREGLPVNVMEAMMSNLPVIATNCRGQRDLADKKNIVELDDLNGLIDKMKAHIKQNISFVEYDVSKIELEEIKEKMKRIYFNNN